jgi:hypothetical protein
MMPIATISLVTADQLSCRLAAADDHTWPECASTAPNHHSFVREPQPIRLIAAIISAFGPPRRSPRGPHGRPLHRRPQPNPHSAR